MLQRLDRDTSGLVTAAFTAERKAVFRKLFSGSGVEKTYLALVTNGAPSLAGEHHLWLEAEGGAKVRAHRASPKGKAEEAVLNVELCKSSGEGALVRVTTAQGGRHVVRAGLAALGAPLFGDALYGGEAGAPRHQLHALRLRLVSPQAFPLFPEAVETPPPASFLDSAARLGLHWTG
jgi:23S rRNA pseudouridine1911/1915/1917 synthase